MQLFRSRQGVPSGHQLAGQGLAAGKQIAQGMEFARRSRVSLQIIEKRPQHGRHKMQHRDAPGFYGLRNEGGIFLRTRPQQGKARALP